jgi:hypothetical protein
MGMSEYIRPWHCIGRTGAELDEAPFVDAGLEQELWRARYEQPLGGRLKAPLHDPPDLRQDRYKSMSDVCKNRDE